ncbi:MAG TPA: TIGR04283 family arsenosugar biosynthesis glycosyltransferase [Candidatus Aquicultoraceae bacterium]|jgi:rSAM/selenodomain-associated transferase 2|nr:TIGR04283 family arsenosugar biosynthesis glycosyltransferase [Candidatus Aquicultoraceae bacterium]
MTGAAPPLSVSVIIPARNEAANVAATVRAARAAGADEVIVVDGGSGDGTLEVSRPVADSVILSPPGRARQMNAGAEASRGDVLLFLHADTALPAESITSVRDAVRGGKILGGAFRVRLGVSPCAPLLRRAALAFTARMINARSRFFRTYTGDQAIFVRRDVFERIGAYPGIPLMEDVELSRRLAREGNTALLPARVTTSARRWEARGTARTILLMWGLRLAYRLGMPADRCAEIYGRPVIPRSSAGG